MKPEYFIWLQQAPKEAMQKQKAKKRETSERVRVFKKRSSTSRDCTLHTFHTWVLWHRSNYTIVCLERRPQKATPINRSGRWSPRFPHVGAVYLRGVIYKIVGTYSSNIPKARLDIVSQYEFEWLSGLGSLVVVVVDPLRGVWFFSVHFSLWPWCSVEDPVFANQ